MPWGEADEEARREEGMGAAAKREKEDSVREGTKEAGAASEIFMEGIW